MTLPQRLVRRLFLWPLPVIAVVLVIAAVPLLVLVALVLSYRLCDVALVLEPGRGQHMTLPDARRRCR